MPSAEEVAWAAGLFEGEGSIVARGRTAAEVVLGMTDEDVVRRFAKVIGATTVSVVDFDGQRKPMFRCSIGNAAGVRRVIDMLLPYLGERRTAKAQEILARIESCPGPTSQRTACPRGHAYDEANTYIVPKTGARHCRQCNRSSSRLMRAA